MEQQKNKDPHSLDNVYQWLQFKMKQKFNRDFNLEKECVIHFEDQGIKVALTPESSEMSQNELLGFSFFVEQINNDEITWETMQNDIKS